MNKVKTLITLLLVGIFGFGVMSAQTEDTLKLEDLAVTGQVGYESDYVFRGQKVSNEDVAVVSFATEYKKVYVGMDSFWSIASEDFSSEVDLFVGMKVDDVLFDGTFVDVGIVGYFYNADFSPDTTEIYVGVGADLYIVDLDGYLYYDIDRESLTAIASATNTLQLTDKAPVFGKLFLITRGELGFVNDNDELSVNPVDYKYGFASVSTDLVVFVKDAKLSVGARYNYTDDEDVVDIDDLSWGASLGFAF
jgi:uncharacterized protein (TIGR02001 family)